MTDKMPTFDQLMNPLVQALQKLGGSGSIEEIYDKVVEQENFPDGVISQLHDAEKSNQTEIGYRLAWARTYLKKYGLLENSTRGIWSLNQKANELGKVDPKKVVEFVRALDKKEKEGKSSVDAVDIPEVPDEQEEWKRKLQSSLPKLLPRQHLKDSFSVC